MKITDKKTLLSIFLKTIVTASAVTGTIMSATAGKNFFMGGKTVFMYFTIQSNLALALVCLTGLWMLMSAKEISDSWYTVKLVATVSITLTGAVFCFVLAPTMGSFAWNTQNILTHVIVPVVSIMDYVLMTKGHEYKLKEVFCVILPPLAYVIFAAIGYICNWQFGPGINYPYFFLNWGSPAGAFGITSDLPFLGCMWWILILLILIVLTGLLYRRISAPSKKQQ